MMWTLFLLGLWAGATGGFLLGCWWAGRPRSDDEWSIPDEADPIRAQIVELEKVRELL